METFRGEVFEMKISVRVSKAKIMHETKPDFSWENGILLKGI